MHSLCLKTLVAKNKNIIHTYLLLAAVLCGVSPETVGRGKALVASVGLSGGTPGGFEGEPGGLSNVEDTPGGFPGVEDVIGSLIAASPCVTPEIGVVGQPPEALFDTEGVFSRPLVSFAGLCGRTSPDVVNGVASRFAGLRGRVADACRPLGCVGGPE